MLATIGENLAGAASMGGLIIILVGILLLIKATLAREGALGFVHGVAIVILGTYISGAAREFAGHPPEPPEVDEQSVAARTLERAFTPEAIRAIRQRCGLTQGEADFVFGAGQKSFEKYERGEAHPSESVKRLLRLAMEHPDLFRLQQSVEVHHADRR
jgi:DNA-binding transcriptional regulator YiaG